MCVCCCVLSMNGISSPYAVSRLEAQILQSSTLSVLKYDYLWTFSPLHLWGLWEIECLITYWMEKIGLGKIAGGNLVVSCPNFTREDPERRSWKTFFSSHQRSSAEKIIKPTLHLSITCAEYFWNAFQSEYPNCSASYYFYLTTISSPEVNVFKWIYSVCWKK